MQNYGRLFGFICLIKDNRHDEVFIERTQQIVMRNNIWLFTTKELREIARPLGYTPEKMSKVNYKFTIIDWSEINGIYRK